MSFSFYRPSGAKNKSFMDMIRSAKSVSNQEEELDDDDGQFVLKKETSPIPKGNFQVTHIFMAVSSINSFCLYRRKG